MTVKYRRQTLSGGSHDPAGRYELRPGQSGAPARRRLLYIYLAVAILAAASLLFHYLTTHRMSRWLPERSGTAVVVEKLAEGSGSETRYSLRVRVLVPAASPAEAALVPEDFPDRDEIVGPRQLEDTVATPFEDWSSVDAGTRLRASYQINIPRSGVTIHSLYLDSLDDSRDPGDAPSALP